MSILTVQMLVSLAVIAYFNKIGRSGAGDYWKTLIAPALGAIAQIVVAILLIMNLPFLAESEEPVVLMIPLYVLIVGLIGFFLALYFRKASPHRYERIGMVYDDSEVIEQAEEAISEHHVEAER